MEDIRFFGNSAALIHAMNVENNITIINTLTGIIVDNRFVIAS